MAIAERTSEAQWQGSLAEGHGTVRTKSGALDALPLTWASRTDRSNGKTSPEDLAAAAHSSCFAMALSLRLGEHGAVAKLLAVSATVSLDDVDGRPTIVSSAVRVRASVPGLDEGDFKAVVDEAARLCPVSRLFAGAQISVDAELEPA